MERMWKRIPRPGKVKESQVIGNPVLLESSMNKDRLDRMPDIVTAHAGHQPVQPIARTNVANRDNIESVTSVYSQHPYGGTQYNTREPVASSYYGDVSPPDSPTILGIRSNNSGDVSPVDKSFENDIHPAFRINQKPAQSHIPVPNRRPQQAKVDTSPTGNRAYNRDISKPLKWDKYTGEPTTSQKGLPSGVMPGNIVAGLEKTRLKRVADRPAAARPSNDLTIDTRPPWKGASGRSATVEPVRDQPASRNPIEHRKLPPTGLPSPPPSSSPIVARKQVPLDSETSAASTALHSHVSRETIKPVTQSQHIQPQQATPPIDHNTPNMAGAYPSPPLAEGEITPRGSSDTVRKQRRQQTDSTTVNIGSRFSWTTQATNTTYQQDSPPPSPPPPMPIPMQTTQALSSAPAPVPASSIMNRKRPVPSARNHSPEPASPIIINEYATRRKAVGLGVRNTGDTSPQQSSPHPPRTSSRAPSIASTITGAKALPPTPLQLSSQDHVSVLQAQLSDLALQRNNVTRVLRDLTAPEATNPLKTNFLVEREREKRVLALRDELAEIQAAEHDIGLKLHRSNKRREREEGSEGFTTLWVRRVTS